MIALTLLALVAMQDTNTALSPRVRAMIDRFPLPRAGAPSIAIRYSRDTVWVGEQVELVTAAWFPRRLRERLRRPPNLRPPSLSGVWSARNQMQPITAEARVIGGQTYDLFVSYQTIFPLGPGRIDAPAAVLTYDVPTSTSYFAPEERQTVVSTAARLVARPVPPELAAKLGTGPTAHGVRLVWRAPADGLRVGSPAIVELAISGAGNLTLWPVPPITWPSGVHVYPEPTNERQVPAQGMIAGEKSFRFTVVADSAGVLTLPAVSYPFFDPVAGVVRPAGAAALSLPIRPRPRGVADRKAPAIASGAGVPISSRIVRSAGPILVIVALLPVLLAVGRRVQRRRFSAVAAPSSTDDPEAALRAALGTPVESGPDHIVAALRNRGIPRDEAEHILRWLRATGRRRYGPGQVPAPEAPPAVTRVLTRLRRGATLVLLLVAVLPLSAQQDDGMSRYAGGDYAGAARAFASLLDTDPAAANAWLDLGAARWMQGDDVAAAAAWIRALELAPRDPRLRAAWRDAVTIPADVRRLAPIVPASRDELLLAALVLWLALWVSLAVRWRTLAWSLGAATVVILAIALARVRAAPTGRALVTVNGVLRISPQSAMESTGEVQAWALVHIDRRNRDWVLVTAEPATGTTGSMGPVALQGWIPAASVAEIDPVRPMIRRSTPDGR